MEMINNKITQIYLVHFKQIPLIALGNKEKIEKFKQLFKFNNVEVLQNQNGEIIAIRCNNGIYESLSGQLVIDNLQFEDRKIQFLIQGSSDDGYELFEELIMFLKELSRTKSDDFMQPIIKSEVSEIIAKLNFPMTRILNQKYVAFINSVVTESASSEMAIPHISTGTVNTIVDYVPEDSSLSDFRVFYSRKEFTISPERGYPINDQIYYSKAPFDTKSHIKALEELEKIFSD